MIWCSRSSHAQRPGPDGDVELLVAERLAGTFTRQAFLGDTVDAEHVEADYTAGVLTLSIPVHEAPKPRKVEITSQDAMRISPGSHPLSPLPQASLSRASGTCPAARVLRRLVKRRVRAFGAPKTRIHLAGSAAVTAAKANGAWTALDETEMLAEPADLAAALDATPGARWHWDAFPRSARRAILEWITNAKTSTTREARIQRTADDAARNIRANQWRQPTGRRPPRPATPAAHEEHG